MKICIFGAGAIGGFVGGMLAETGVDVSLIARGANLSTLRSQGLTLISQGRERVYHLPCTDDPHELGPQDYVFITLKAHAVPGIAAALKPLLKADTSVVMAVNGLPWWYFYKCPGAFENHQLDKVDPGGVQWREIGPERVLGCVVWPAAELVRPGVVVHKYGNRIPIGEPDGSRSERASVLSKAMMQAGFRSPVARNLRNEIWMKLWGNVSLNPVSALTHATLGAIAGDPALRGLVRQMMIEAEQIGLALGVKFSMTVDQRIDTAAEIGDHRTSMLEDLDQGRPMEIDPLVGVVTELARLVDIPTPTIDAVLALVTARAREAGCYPAGQITN